MLFAYWVSYAISGERPEFGASLIHLDKVITSRNDVREIVHKLMELRATLGMRCVGPITVLTWNRLPDDDKPAN